MKQQEKNKFRVAWFKLSEFIERGEKERALGIYKLLMHTIDDQAFAKQLEGDLYLFFNENDAKQHYVNAADLYYKANKLAQATAIYEHLVLQYPDDANLLPHLARLYIELNHPTRITLSMSRLIKASVEGSQIQSIEKALEIIEQVIDLPSLGNLYAAFTYRLIEDAPERKDSILYAIEKTLRCLKNYHAEYKHFMAQLHQLSNLYYNEAKDLEKQIETDVQ